MATPEQQNKLEEYRAQVLNEIEAIRDRVRSERIAKGYVSEPSFSNRLGRFLATRVGDIDSSFPFDLFDIDVIERSDFQADIVFKSTKLMSADKAKYFKEDAPRLLEILKKIEDPGALFFESVQIVGIYVNAKLNSNYLFKSLEQVFSLGSAYGNNDSGRGADIVFDYSSPNAAKHLHAGHIRSTIIGHVFANIYEANGYTAHRLNYLNDWGGMGFLMQGLAKRSDSDIESYENKNDLLFEIYTIFRKAQKSAESNDNFDKLNEADRSQIVGLVGKFDDFSGLVSRYEEYVRNSNEKFSALENGESDAYETWRKIVNWSLQDFEKFYEILDIHHDCITGEWLYAKSGKDLVLREAQKGTIVFFDKKLADLQIAELQSQLDSQKITAEVFDRKKEEALSDIGSYVVPLENNERFVVLKQDGSTIYATRDMAAIEQRMQTYQPKGILYEAGQEQQEHFDKLFRSARNVGIAKDVDLKHIYHGFYVDEATKKKLSSRDGASNILKLLGDTVAFFKSKYEGNDEFDEAEKVRISRSLGVWSIIFNDIKRDRKSSVGISSDFEKMMKQFEESGGAYLVYASCRAKSIIRKYAKPLPELSRVQAKGFLDIEVDLIKKILTFPDVVRKAAENDEPSRIAEFLTSLAAAFNSYYNSVPILKGDDVEKGILIAYSVSVVIDNGLRMLHVGTLDRI